MAVHRPGAWLLVEIKNKDTCVTKIMAGWRGSYTSGSSWRLSSNIVSAEILDDSIVEFKTESGSTYKVYIDGEGFIFAMNEIVAKLERAKDKGLLEYRNIPFKDSKFSRC